jgi:hypothetical protein
VVSAIAFVEKHDTLLWGDLIDFSLQHPLFLTGLLKHAGGTRYSLTHVAVNINLRCQVTGQTEP